MSRQLNTLPLSKESALPENATIREAMQKIHSLQKGAVVFTENDKPIGIITERDLVWILNNNISVSKPAFPYSNQDLITALTERPIEHALHLMIDHNIRRIVAVNAEGNFAGLITHEDLLHYISGNPGEAPLTAMHIMGNRGVILWLSPSTTIREALRIMVTQKISMLPIVENKKAVGLITESDFLHLENDDDQMERPVTEIMSSPVITIDQYTAIENLIKIMHENNVRHLLVTDPDQTPIGTITIRDILRNLKGSYSRYLESRLKHIRAAMDSFLQLVLEISLVQDEYLIQWANRSAHIFFKINPVDQPLQKLLPDYSWERLLPLIKDSASELKKEIEINSKSFEVTAYSEPGSNVIQLLFNDVTHLVNLNREYIKKLKEKELVQGRLVTEIEARRKSEEMYRQILETTQEGFWMISSAGYTVSVNESLCRMLGYTEHELKEKLPEDLTDDGIIHSGENQLNHKSGSRIPVLINASVVAGNTNASGYQVLFITDISNLRNAEREIRDHESRIRDLLEESNRKLEKLVKSRTHDLEEALTELNNSRDLLKTIMDTSPVAIIRFDKNGKLMFANRLAEKINDYMDRRIFSLGKETQSGVFGEGPFLLHQDGTVVEKDQCPLNIIKENTGVHERTYAVRKADNAVRYIRLHASPVTNPMGDFDGGVMAITDITDQLNLYKEKISQEQILIHQSRMAAIGEMIAAISHQWKQPLNGLALLLEDLEDLIDLNQLTPDNLKNFIRNSRKQIEFMSVTMDSFRNFYRNTGSSEFKLKESISEMLHLLGKQFSSHHLEIQTEYLTDKEIRISGKSNEFMQVLLSLAANSRDAVEDRIQKGELPAGYRGILTIKIELIADTRVQLTLCDNAGGIPEAVIDRIFEPYFTTRENKGTGVGLSISRSIIRKMGGSISVKNTETGACFTIITPVLST